MKKEKTILFDFDGVIVDSFRTAFETRKSFQTDGDFSEDDYREGFEGNIFDSPGVASDKYQHKYFAAYNPKLSKLPVIAGIREALIELSSKHRLIIISSAVSDSIQTWLAGHELAQHFTEIMGMDVHRSKIAKIKMVFEKHSIGAEDCLFITDTLGDIKEAREVGVDSLAVTYGFHEEARLLKGNPSGLIKRPEEMVDEIKKYWDYVETREI